MLGPWNAAYNDGQGLTVLRLGVLVSRLVARHKAERLVVAASLKRGELVVVGALLKQDQERGFNR